MIRAYYKRKGRKYLVDVSFNSCGTVKIFRLLARGFVNSCGDIRESISGIYAQVFNAIGVWDCATFPPGRSDLAKAWVYKSMRSKSPQLSLFGDGI